MMIPSKITILHAQSMGLDMTISGFVVVGVACGSTKSVPVIKRRVSKVFCATYMDNDS